MVAAYSTMLIIWIGVWQTMARQLIGLRFCDMGKDVMPFLLSAAACMVASYYATSAISQPVVSLAARIAIAALLYMGIMKVARVKIFDECISYFLQHIKRKKQ
jgi:hypothetical protein